MFSLLITIISIALVAALALATLYYGGAAYNSASADAKAAQIRNGAQQLLGAADLFYASTGRYPASTQDLVDEKYLKTIPFAQRALAQAAANNSEWSIVTPGMPVFLLNTSVPEACRSLNEDSFGNRGISLGIDPTVTIQCFGANTSALVTLAAKGLGHLERAVTDPGASPTLGTSTLSSRPGTSSAAGWSVRPTDGVVSEPTAPPVALTYVGEFSVFSGTDFGTVTVGETATRSFRFSNKGTGTLSPVAASLTGAGLSFAANGCGTSSAPVSLAPAAECEVTVQFAPGTEGALSGAALAVTSRAATLPESVPLQGFGGVAMAENCRKDSANEVWCKSLTAADTGASICGYPPGYAGTYFSATPASVAAWGMTLAVNRDCATNYTGNISDSTVVHSSTLGCWSDSSRWARRSIDSGSSSQLFVRCISME